MLVVGAYASLLESAMAKVSHVIKCIINPFHLSWQIEGKERCSAHILTAWLKFPSGHNLIQIMVIIIISVIQILSICDGIYHKWLVLASLSGQNILLIQWHLTQEVAVCGFGDEYPAFSHCSNSTGQNTFLVVVYIQIWVPLRAINLFLYIQDVPS